MCLMQLCHLFPGYVWGVGVCVHMCMFSRSAMSDTHGLQHARSSVLGILQARILEWIAISSSRESS